MNTKVPHPMSEEAARQKVRELQQALRAFIAIAERNVVPGFQDLRAARAVIDRTEKES